jgi:predicted kinase
MSKAWVLVGAPASGKSWYARELAKKQRATIIEGDQLRMEIGLNEGEAKWHELADAIEESIEAHIGKPLILDGTHYTRQAREECLTLLRSYGYDPVNLVHVLSDLDICIRRNARRSRCVPRHMVIEMFNRIKKESPSFDLEGFNLIERVFY